MSSKTAGGLDKFSVEEWEASEKEKGNKKKKGFHSTDFSGILFLN